MTDIAMFDCFFCYLHERSPLAKKQRQAKMQKFLVQWYQKKKYQRYNGKVFYYKVGALF